MDDEDISVKLKQEEKWLNDLKKSLEKSQQCKSNMLGLLDSFVDRLESLEATILPLYEQTAQLHTQQQNISKTLKTTENTLSYYTLANEMDSSIRDSDPSYDLEAYIKQMELLKGARNFFAADPKQSTEADSIRSLFEYGCGSLEKEFRQVLRQNSYPAEVSEILECINDTTFGGRRTTMFNLGKVTEQSYEGEADTFIVLLAAFQLLLERECFYIDNIFHGIEVKKMKANVAIKPLNYVLEVGQELLQQVKKSQARQDYAAVFCLFHVVKYFRESCSKLDIFLEESHSPIQVLYGQVVRETESLCIKGLEDFIESIKTDSDKSIPKDGTVHQITSNQTILPSVITRVLSGLGLSLRNKGELYSDTTLKAVFMLNNYNYILKTLKKSGGLKVVSEQNKEVASYYEQQIREYKAQYLQCWVRLISYISEPRAGYSPSPLVTQAQGHLRDKDRQFVKEAFAGFNRELENILGLQKSYSLPEADLAAALVKESKTLVLPPYSGFFKKWANCNFSKAPEKYVRYAPEQVDALLDGLFGAR